ncbi:hypothetical protein BZA70DRAFT_289731 [Myxozyma melibiosi]|uniref:Uncharacterized protein n=1 Tax=Myxozyma melibiosi TaxID=54550 RepID=A0ABR1F5G9_9ASCO
MSISAPQLTYKTRMSVYEYFGTATSLPANDRWSADKIAGADMTTATDSRTSNSASDVHISVHSCGSKLSAKTDYIPLKMNLVNKIDEEQRGDCQNEFHLEASQDLGSDPATAASQPKYPVCGCGSPMINTNQSNSDRSLPRINGTILDEINQWFAEWSQGEGFDPEVDYDPPCSAVVKPADVEELHGDVDGICDAEDGVCDAYDQARQVAPTGGFLEGKRSEFFDDLWKTLSTGSTASSEHSSSSRSRAVPGIVVTEPSTCDTLQAARQTSADQEDDTVLFHSVRIPRPVTDFRNLEPDMFGHRHGSISSSRSVSPPPPSPPQQLQPENKMSSVEDLPSSRKSKLATFFNLRKSHPPLVDGSETSSSNQALRVLRDRLQQARARVRSLIDVKAGEFAGAIARDAGRGRGGKVTAGK